MKKLSEIITELKPHQQRVVDRIQKQPGLVVAHGMGSGKTLTSIAAAERLGGNTTAVVPASLQSNYQKELDKHLKGTPNSSYDIQSLQRQALQGSIAPTDNLIVDEAHRIRDPSSMSRKVVRGAEAKKRMLLTGTPLYNRPYDIASLVNVAAGENVLPPAQADFEKRYIGERKVDPGWIARTFRGVKPGSVAELKRKDELSKILGQWVDFHENTTENFPTRHDEVVNTPLGKEQQNVYNALMGEAPSWIKYKVQHGLPPSKQESKDLNAFSSGVRQVSLSPAGFQEGVTPDQAAAMSPKLQTAYQRLSDQIEKNPQHRALVYSNFLESGLHPYETMLQQGKIPYGKFTGELSKSERDQMVTDYNSGKLRALMLSSAGGEGLDLKGTRQIQVLEPHFNKEKLEQVIARGIRYGSHAHLPEDQRNVAVEHYVSQLPKPGIIRRAFGAKRPGSIDEYLRTLSSQKDELNQQVRDILKTTTEQHSKTSGLMDVVVSYSDLMTTVC
jgi:SNF2 family DNA or RNA helicase